MNISIVLPVYNPADGWAGVVLSKTAELRSHYQGIGFEVIVVSDGSGGPAFAEGKKMLGSGSIRLIEYTPNKGKGAAIRTGVKAATGDLVVYTDIDFPYTIDSVRLVIDLLIKGENDVVIGIKDHSYYDHVPPVRRFISRFFRTLIRIFFRIPTDDTQCGLKGFNQKGKDIFLKTTIDRYLFDLEFIFLASREKNIRISTCEVKLREDVQFRRMNFGIIRSEAWNFLKILIRS